MIFPRKTATQHFRETSISKLKGIDFKELLIRRARDYRKNKYNYVEDTHRTVKPSSLSPSYAAKNNEHFTRHHHKQERKCQRICTKLSHLSEHGIDDDNCYKAVQLLKLLKQIRIRN